MTEFSATCSACGHIITGTAVSGEARTFWSHLLDPVFYRDTPHQALPAEGSIVDMPGSDPRIIDGLPGSF